MKEFLATFYERPLSHKVAAVVLSLAVIGGLLWQYILGPALVEHEEKLSKKESLNSQIITERRLAMNLPRFQEEVKELEAKLKVALQELPDEKDIPALLESVASLAKDAGLEVSVFRPEPESRRDFYAEVPVAMIVEGAYHQIAVFFDEVGRLPRIVNVKGINLKDPRMSEKGLNVKAEFKAVTFRFVPESERVQAPKDGDTKKRRR